MKSVITRFEENTSEQMLGKMPYIVEVRGQRVPNLRVEKLTDIESGAVTVLVEVPKSDGRAILAVSTMDALARRVKPDARAYAGNKHGAVARRMYS